jgi:hypothetical protein
MTWPLQKRKPPVRGRGLKDSVSEGCDRNNREPATKQGRLVDRWGHFHSEATQEIFV